MGMFEDERIDNDLLLVEQAVREYYEIQIPEKAEGGDDEKTT
jgi:hypothetical protein